MSTTTEGPGPAPKTLVGYTDRTGVRAGESIRLMVSCFDGGTYRVRIVRRPDGTPVPSPVEGEVRGREQPLHPGSHAVVPGVPATPSFTVQAVVWPTTPQGRDRAILTRGARGAAGFGLFVDASGAAAVALGEEVCSEQCC